MKIVIDLDRALADGRLTAEEAARLRAIAAGQTSFLAANLVTGFGIVAVAGGLVALFASVIAVATVGLALALAGAAIALNAADRWRLLGQILLVVGSLMLGGLVAEWEGSREAFLVCLPCSPARGFWPATRSSSCSRLLALSALLGARAGHWHATYALGLEAPGLTIVAFTGLGIALYALSRRVSVEWSGLAIAACRTCVLLVNLGFWIGSLWGDRSLGVALPPVALAVGWALAIAAGARLGVAGGTALARGDRGRVRGHPRLHPMVRAHRRLAGVSRARGRARDRHGLRLALAPRRPAPAGLKASRNHPPRHPFR
jgi:hypothetical protein